MAETTERFAAVVVGSGFGGSVIAHRLAAEKKTVCLLERGRAYAPGTFARTPRQTARNFWDPRAAQYGLFDIWSFRHLEAVVSAGLGGGSLIYANVLIRKDEHWFVRDGYRGSGYEYWPITRADLDPHYASVEKMLDAQVYPFRANPYSATAKTIAMKKAASALCIQETKHDKVDPTRDAWYLPLLAVSFSADGKTGPGLPLDAPNLHHAPRQTCRLCGECDIGCNYGAKNTLDLTYLSSLNPTHACIRTLAEVIGFERCRDGRRGYVVHYLNHDEAAASTRPRSARIQSVEADTLVLACGTLGTTFLLLKHQEDHGGLSSTLGTRFCGNGDVINFVFGCKDRDARGGTKPRFIESSHGPVITSTFRFADSVDNGAQAGRGLYLQDAGYPLILDWLVELANVPAESRRISLLARTLLKRWFADDGDSEIGGDVASLLGTGTLSATILGLLGMGREEPDGILRLAQHRKRRRLELDWDNALAKPYFDRVMDKSRAIGNALGGSFVPDPLTRFLNRLITVHPVGGCPMGRTSNEGVVDEYGEVFGYDDLFVVDGSVMPGPVGPNPSLTIAAFADRTADYILTGKPKRSK